MLQCLTNKNKKLDLLSQRGRAMLPVCQLLASLVGYITSSEILYHWLFRLQIYRCVQLICSLLFSVFTDVWRSAGLCVDRLAL